MNGRRSTLLIVSLSIILFVSTGLTINAQVRRHMTDFPDEYYDYCGMEHGMMGYGMMGNMGCPMKMNLLGSVDFYLTFSDELELSSKQMEKMKDIRSEYERDAIEKSADLMKLMFELRTELSEDDIDLNEIKGINKKIESLQSDLRYRNIEAYVKAREVLTDEQLRKIWMMEMTYYREGKGHSGMMRCR